MDWSSKSLVPSPCVGSASLARAARSLRLIAAITALNACSGGLALAPASSHHAVCGSTRSVTSRQAVVRMPVPSALKVTGTYTCRSAWADAVPPDPRQKKPATAASPRVMGKARKSGEDFRSDTVITDTPSWTWLSHDLVCHDRG